jgi:hypothetical protein
MAIQSGFAEAVHAHPAATVTEKLPLPPSLPKARAAGATAKEQAGVGSFGVPNPAQPAAPAYRTEATTMASSTGARMRHLGSLSRRRRQPRVLDCSNRCRRKSGDTLIVRSGPLARQLPNFRHDRRLP